MFLCELREIFKNFYFEEQPLETAYVVSKYFMKFPLNLQDFR